ncbi:MAG TPA: DUF1592 domain-containing protein [Polyangia bacterium]
MPRIPSSLRGITPLRENAPPDPALRQPRRPARTFVLACLLAAPGVACVGSVDSMSPSEGPPGASGPGGSAGSGGGSMGQGPGGSGPGPTGPMGGQTPPSGFIASNPGPSSRLIRLSHLQWENTVRDLFRLPQPTGLSAQFISDTFSTTFDNSGGTAEVAPQLWTNYRRAADDLAKRFSRDATALASLIPKGAPGDAEGKARAFIRDFGRRAYRRPFTDAEVEQYVSLYKQGPMLVASTDAFADGIELVLATMLQSPHFLYRTEMGAGAATAGKIQLTDHEVASRLSYALTNTMPDDALATLADGKKLRTKEAVYAEAKRLLDSAGGKAAIGDMYNQLFREIDPSEISRDTMLVPAFMPGMGPDMKRETELFVQEAIFARNGGLKELFTAPYTFVNARLAPLYGVSAPSGGGFGKVDLNPAQRGGLYTQLGFLSKTGNDHATQPIMRGVHLNRHVLCVAVPPPPDNVDTKPPPATAAMTNRQHFEQLTSAGECQGCHGALINPLGFAFENYDNLGRYRTKEGNFNIDATASYSFTEGRKDFNGAIELMKLIADSQQASDCFAHTLFAYFYGRESLDNSPADKALLGEISKRSRSAASVKSLILDLVSTDAFLYRLP